jgi:hypothetical protein
MESPAVDPDGNWWSDQEPEPRPGRTGAILRAVGVTLVAAIVLAGLCLVGLIVTR